jgi:hypothetical protein
MVLSSLLAVSLAASPGLLPSAAVVRDEKVARSTVLRDGRAPAEGDNWDTPQTAIIAPDGVLVFDLGVEKHIAAGMLQGDNNDDYLISGSVDGVTYTPLWRVPPDPTPGMRTRTVNTLDANARYLRLTASGGDGLFSVGELMLFSTAAELTPDVVSRPQAMTAEDSANAAFPTVFFGIVVLVFVVAVARRSAAKPNTPPSA